MPNDTDFVPVPRWAIELILRRGDFQDEGPAGEGWSSPEMKRALEAIEKAISHEQQERGRTNGL